MPPFAVAAMCLLLWACGHRPELDDGAWRDRLTLHTARENQDTSANPAIALSNRRPRSFSGLEVRGQDAIGGYGQKLQPLDFNDDGEPVTVNLLHSPIEAAAKAVLGDLVGVNYSIDTRVQGEITLQTARPVAKTELLKNFQTA